VKNLQALYLLGQVDEKYIAEAAPPPQAAEVIRRRKHRLPVALVAALLALLLMGAGVVAVIYGDSIQSWFSYNWERLTGQPMSQKQTAIIDHLSQDIGLSQTVDGVTVTVDSATVGEDVFYLLVKVEGLPFSMRHGYHFEQFHVELTPDPLEDSSGMGAMGLNLHGVDGDGAAVFLLEHEYSSHDGFEAETSPVEVMVYMKDLLRGGQKEKLVAEGEWEFSFTLDRSAIPPSVSLPDTMVTALNDANEYISLLHTEIVLSSTSLRFCHEFDGFLGPHNSIDYMGYVDTPPELEEQVGMLMIPQSYALLENGAMVGLGSGLGVPLKDEGLMSHVFHWKVPINPDEVSVIIIGQTEIPVP